MIESMLHLALKGRCSRLEEDYGIKISPFTLRQYYRAAKVKYKKPKRWMDSTRSEEQLKIERMAFMTTLVERMRSKELIIYFDEGK